MKHALLVVAVLLLVVPTLSHAAPCLTCDDGGGDPQPKPKPKPAPAPAPPACPNPVPPLPDWRPATEDEIRCKALQKCEASNASSSCQRCGAPLTFDDCNWSNDFSFNNNLMDSAALTWLRANKFCAVPQPPGFKKIIDVCPEGCFAAETSILVAGDTGAVYLPASTLQTSQSVFAIADESTMEELWVAPRPLKRIVHGGETSELYVFHLSNGKALKVTQHHPMVLADGTVVRASTVPGDALFLDVDGLPVSILEITREMTDKEVFNVWTESDSLQGHVIVAEGVLTGDLELQGDVGREGAMIELRR